MMQVSQVDKNLWLGGRPEEDSDYDYIAGLGIQYVVDLTSGIGYDRSDDGTKWAELGLMYKHVPIVDMLDPTVADTEVLINDVFPMIESGFNTYIHCMRGHGRAPMIAILYLMKTCNLPYKDAYAQIYNSHDTTSLTYEQEEFLRKHDQSEEEDKEAELEEERYNHEVEKEYFEEKPSGKRYIQ